LSDSKAKILVLAAHPDDETIGASSVLGQNPQTEVVFLTDGAPRDRKLWSSGMSCSREEYAAIRRQEATKALAIAGINQANITFLQAVDQEAMEVAGDLVQTFQDLVRKISPDMVITHPYEGGHPDHDAAAFVAALAIRSVSRASELVEMTSYHVRGQECVTGEFLRDDAGIFVRELSVQDRERKLMMMECYASQRNVLQSFSKDREKFRKAPTYEFTYPPHDGNLWYEIMGWGTTGKHWRFLAAKFLNENLLRKVACN
jgi:LmbE family N-acetylglucosaminyl deacetylase